MHKTNRCYLSGPITGVDGYMRIFNHYERLLTEMFGWTIINPAKVGLVMPSDTAYVEYMEMSEMLLKMCDRIFSMPGWRNSRGAKFERELATIRNIEVWEENEDGEIKLVGGGHNALC